MRKVNYGIFMKNEELQLIVIEFIDRKAMTNDVGKIIKEVGEKIEKVSDLVTTITDNELVKASGEIFKFVDLGIKVNNWISQTKNI